MSRRAVSPRFLPCNRIRNERTDSATSGYTDHCHMGRVYRLVADYVVLDLEKLQILLALSFLLRADLTEAQTGQISTLQQLEYFQSAYNSL